MIHKVETWERIGKRMARDHWDRFKNPHLRAAFRKEYERLATEQEMAYIRAVNNISQQWGRA